MGNVIASTEQMIEKINDVLKTKKNAVVNIVNDKLTLSVFALLEQNLKNVKEINFVIRDTKFVPEKSEISHEFEDWTISLQSSVTPTFLELSRRIDELPNHHGK